MNAISPTNVKPAMAGKATDLSWSQLEFFHAVATSASLAEAAIQLGTTASAVSQRLSSLERLAGQVLVNRSRSGSAPNEAGERLLAYCRKMQALAQEARDSLPVQHEAGGVLKITYPHGLADSLVIPVLAEYLQLHPNLRFHLVGNDSALDMKSAQFDLALRFGWVFDGQFIAKRLASYREVVCASPAYLHRHGTPASPADLVSHQWIGYAGFGSSSHRLMFVNRAGLTEPIEVRPRVLTTVSTSIATWLAEGAGLSMQPEPIVRDALASGRLVEVLTDYTLPGPSLFAVYRRDLDLARLRPLLAFLTRKFKV